MARQTGPGPERYDAGSAKKSRNLLALLAALVVLILVVFAILHGFGMTLGVQI